MFNIDKVREDFPILGREVYNKPLVYLDNAATTQKPLMVLREVMNATMYVCIHIEVFIPHGVQYHQWFLCGGRII